MKPFVHKFQTQRNKYVYDINSNRVFKVSDVTFDIVDDYLEKKLGALIKAHPDYSAREIHQSLRAVREMKKKHGCFSSARPKRMAYPHGNDIESLLKNEPRDQLILNITEKCNLRCKYCAYSGLYPGQRRHADRDMPFDTAINAVNKFTSNMSQEPCLSFYGGEPLLKLNLIKKIINYVDSLKQANMKYSMTTNGTLLTPETADYIRSKDFMLLVSLDGPISVHDRYRKFPNGKGSFHLIMDNLRYLKSLDEDYYKNKVTFSIVSAPPHRLQQVNDFFSSEPLVSGNKISFSYMDSTIQHFDYSMNQERAERAVREKNLLYDRFEDNILEEGDRDPFLTSYFEDDYLRFYHRPKAQLSEVIALNGCCIPGTRRLFITVDGILHVCERMDNAYPIGDIDGWIDMDRVCKLIEDYVTMSPDCVNCWACRLCSACFAQLAVGGVFDPEFRARECHATRKRLHNMLVHYYGILEHNDTAWDYMKDISLE